MGNQLAYVKDGATTFAMRSFNPMAGVETLAEITTIRGDAPQQPAPSPPPPPLPSSTIADKESVQGVMSTADTMRRKRAVSREAESEEDDDDDEYYGGNRRNKRQQRDSNSSDRRRGGGGDEEENNNSRRRLSIETSQTIAAYFRAISFFAVVLMVVDLAVFCVAMSTQISRPRVLDRPQLVIFGIGFAFVYVCVATLLYVPMRFASRAKLFGTTITPSLPPAGGASSSSLQAAMDLKKKPFTLMAIHGFWDPFANFVGMMVAMFSGATIALSLTLMILQTKLNDEQLASG